MDFNNSMIFNPNSTEEKSSNSTKRKKGKKNIETNTKINSKQEITCQKETKKTYNITSEEFAIHIIDCTECLKQLFLDQAKIKEKESELLLEKKNKKKKKNISGDKNIINNSMDKGCIIDTADNSEESSEDEGDNSSNDEDSKNSGNNSMIKPKKIKIKANKKKKRKESSSESGSDEENEGDKDDEDDDDKLGKRY